MDLRTAVYGSIAVRSGTDVTGIELGALVQRLLLFDRVVIASVRLREIPYLVRAFGRSGFLDLIGSGILQIVCEFTSTSWGVTHNGIPSLPPSHYSFATINIHDRAKVLASECVCLQSIIGLKNADREALQATILTRLIRPSNEYGERVRLQIESDLRCNSPALKASVTKQLTANSPKKADSLKIDVEETQERVFHIKYNLTEAFEIDQPAATKIIEKSICAVVSANHRIADMEAYSALTGFAEDEAEILFGKLKGILSTMNPKAEEDNFRRMVKIAQIPDFSTFAKVDVDRLLKVRESQECQEFRAWMRRLENAGDAEVSEMVASLRNKVSLALHSTLGKTLRFVTTSAIGIAPGVGPVAGIGLSAIDTFLVEHLFPEAGPLAFLTKAYPSLFEK